LRPDPQPCLHDGPRVHRPPGALLRQQVRHPRPHQIPRAGGGRARHHRQRHQPRPCATEINTPILNNPELLAKFTAQLPVGRFGKPEEIAALAVFLASGYSGFITGTDVVIDGGWIAQYLPGCTPPTPPFRRQNPPR